VGGRREAPRGRRKNLFRGSRKNERAALAGFPAKSNHFYAKVGNNFYLGVGSRNTPTEVSESVFSGAGAARGKGGAKRRVTSLLFQRGAMERGNDGVPLS
jgi:hypothetical protein